MNSCSFRRNVADQMISSSNATTRETARSVATGLFPLELAVVLVCSTETPLEEEDGAIPALSDSGHSLVSGFRLAANRPAANQKLRRSRLPYFIAAISRIVISDSATASVTPRL